jgi:hypothetical protein
MRLVRTGGVLAATPSSLTTPSSHGAPSLRAPEAAAVHAGVVEPDLDVAIAGDVVVCGGADGDRARARDHRSSRRDDVPASSGCREHVSRARYAGTRRALGRLDRHARRYQLPTARRLRRPGRLRVVDLAGRERGRGVVNTYGPDPWRAPNCPWRRRRRADSNRCTRLCRPLPNLSATAPGAANRSRPPSSLRLARGR